MEKRLPLMGDSGRLCSANDLVRLHAVAQA